jgi:hypothetical protein
LSSSALLCVKASLFMLLTIAPTGVWVKRVINGHLGAPIVVAPDKLLRIESEMPLDEQGSVIRGHLSKCLLVVLGGIHSYKIVYIRFFNREIMSVSY